MKLDALLKARAATHGDFRRVAETSENIMDLLCPPGPVYHPRERVMALRQIALKLARIANGDPDFPDHWRDIAGYATLVADLLEEPRN